MKAARDSDAETVEGSVHRGEVPLWPGTLRLAAQGPGAEDAIARAIHIAQTQSDAFVLDAELLARSETAVLPRTEAGRAVIAHLREISDAIRPHSVHAMPLGLVGLPGAMADDMLASMVDMAGPEAGLVVGLSDAVAWRLDEAAALPEGAQIAPALGELIAEAGLTRGGAVLMGPTRDLPFEGQLDTLGAVARASGLACLCASSIAQACAPHEEEPGQVPDDPLFAAAYDDRLLPKPRHGIETGEIYETLSDAMRRAIRLKDKKLVLAVAVALKGRGRTTGGIDGDRLLRFGVSEWR